MLLSKSLAGGAAAVLALVATAAVAQQTIMMGDSSLLEALQANQSSAAFINLLRSQLPAYIPLLNGTAAVNQDLTVFVPNNAALANFDGSMSTYSLNQILRYHVSNSTPFGNLGAITDGQLINSNLVLQSLGSQPQKIKLLRSARGLLVNRNQIGPVVAASNGDIVYVDGLLLPPGNFTTVVAANGIFKGFSAVLGSVEDQFTNGCPCNFAQTTVLVPTDLAFDLVDPALKGLLLARGQFRNETLITYILSAHIIPNEVIYYRDIINEGSLSVRNLLGFNVDFSVNNNIVTVNNTAGLVNSTAVVSNIVRLHDILTAGGVAHAISSVLVPDDLRFTVADVLIGMNATQFYQAMVRVGLTNILFNQANMYTIFAPADQYLKANAFEDLSDDDLRTLLLTYVIQGRRMTMLPNNLVLDVVSGDALVFNREVFNNLNQFNWDNGMAALTTVSLLGNPIGAKADPAIVRVLKQSTLAQNAVVYTLDSLLLPIDQM